MGDVRSAWNEAAGQLSGLGGKLRQHYEQQHQDDDSGPTRAAADDAAGRLSSAANHVATAARDAVEALGSAAKDPAVKDDVKQAGHSLAGAVGATSTEVSGQVRKAWARYSAGRPDSSGPPNPPEKPPPS
jgi:hypothetical protein